MAKVELVLENTGISTGDQVINFPKGFGVPKGAIFFVCRADVEGASHVQACMGVGVIDGTREYSMSYVSRDARADPDTKTRAKSGKCILIINANTGAVNGEAGFASFGEDQITINWSNASSSNWAFMCIAWSGEDVEAQCGLLWTNATQGEVETVQLPFHLDQLIIFGHGDAFDDVAENAARLSLGFASHNKRENTTKQVCYSYEDKDATDSPEPLNGRAALQYITATGMVAHMNFDVMYNHSISSISGEGFDLRRDAITSGDDAATGSFAYLALNYNDGLDHDVFVYNVNTESGDSYMGPVGSATSGEFAFRPQVGIYAGAVSDELEEFTKPASVHHTASAHVIGAFSFSGQSSPTEQEPVGISRYMTYMSRELATNTDCNIIYADGHIGTFANGGQARMGIYNNDGSADAFGDIVEFRNDGLLMDYQSGGAQAYTWPMMVCGLEPRRSSSTTTVGNQ